MNMVTPVARGLALRSWLKVWMMGSQASSDMARFSSQKAQGPFDHGQIRPPRHDDRLAFLFDVEFQQTAFEQGRLARGPDDAARAHFHPRRLVAVIMPVEL